MTGFKIEFENMFRNSGFSIFMQASAGYAQTKTRKVPVENGRRRADFQWNGGGRSLVR